MRRAAYHTPVFRICSLAIWFYMVYRVLPQLFRDVAFYIHPVLSQSFPYLLKFMSEFFFLSCSITSRRSYYLRSTSTAVCILCNSFSQHYQIDSSSHEFFRTIHLCTVAKESYSLLYESCNSIYSQPCSRLDFTFPIVYIKHIPCLWLSR